MENFSMIRLIYVKRFKKNNKSNMGGFKDAGLTWHQFSHSLGKFMQIPFLGI